MIVKYLIWFSHVQTRTTCKCARRQVHILVYRCVALVMAANTYIWFSFRHTFAFVTTNSHNNNFPMRLPIAADASALEAYLFKLFSRRRVYLTLHMCVCAVEYTSAIQFFIVKVITLDGNPRRMCQRIQTVELNQTLKYQID